MFCVFLQADSGSEFAFQGMYIVWTPKGLGNNIARSVLSAGMLLSVLMRERTQFSQPAFEFY